MCHAGESFGRVFQKSADFYKKYFYLDASGQAAEAAAFD
jgi:hypothetical protein